MAGGVHSKEVPLNPVPMTPTVVRAVDGPFLRVRVTGPSASDQVILKGCPAASSKDGLVNWTALARLAAAAARKRVLNCILVMRIFEEMN